MWELIFDLVKICTIGLIVVPLSIILIRKWNRRHRHFWEEVGKEWAWDCPVFYFDRPTSPRPDNWVIRPFHRSAYDRDKAVTVITQVCSLHDSPVYKQKLLDGHIEGGKPMTQDWKYSKGESDES